MSRALPLLQRLSLSSRRAAMARDLSAKPRCPAEEAVDNLLSGRCFQGETIAFLATRLRYADAIHSLAYVAEPDRTQEFRLPSILTENARADVTLWRLSVRLGFRPLESHRNSTLTAVTLDELRQSQTAASRLVLAAIGELDWPLASRRERAAYCLNALIQAFRRAVS